MKQLILSRRKESKVRVLTNQLYTVMQDAICHNMKGVGCTLARARNISQCLLSNLLFPSLPFFFSIEEFLLLFGLILRFSLKSGFLVVSSNTFSNSIFVHLIYFLGINSSCVLETNLLTLLHEPTKKGTNKRTEKNNNEKRHAFIPFFFFPTFFFPIFVLFCSFLFRDFLLI